jgi:acetylglutamate kinase
VHDPMTTASVLVEALPYIQRFHGKTFVIKYGGHAMEAADLRENFAQDVVLLKAVGMNPVVVHGGGPQINHLIERLGLKSSFVRGMRVTDEPIMEAVEMVLQRLNKEIVALISSHGCRAVGLSGKDADLIIARKLEMTMKDEGGIASKVDIGLVGEVTEVNPQVLRTLEAAGFIPVIAPVGHGRDGLTYNINADVAAGDVAAALGAEKLILLTDVEGVKDKDGKLLATLTVAEARRLIAAGAISDGMIPKVECCIAALKGGVGKTHVIDGRTRHAILLEIFTEAGVGTEVVAGGHAAPAQEPSARRAPT